jgi:putative tricarboxylic transport membrane protein
MDVLSGVAHGFAAAIDPLTLLATFAGAILGTLVGILPGIGSPTAIALLLPLTFSMGPVPALAMLAGVWYGSSFGGIITSVLLNIPGEGDSVIATLDGHEMALKGKGGLALGISAIGGFIAGTAGLIMLMFVGPAAARMSLTFGPPEYFALMLLGLSLIVWLSTGSPAKGFLSAGLGLLVGCVGIDLTSGAERLTFGNVNLLSGIDFVPVVVGLFGFSEVLTNMSEKASAAPRSMGRISLGLKDLLPSNRQEVHQSWTSILRGTIAGLFIGVIPGAGPMVSTFTSYALEKRLSKTPERFGKGELAGVAGPGAASHAATIAGLVPLLSLGLPASATAALILSGFLIHGLFPGPELFNTHPEVVWGLVASLWIANLFLLILNTALIPLLIWALRILEGILPALIAILVILGAYSLRSSVFDVWIALIFGLIGYAFRLFGFPLAPLVIALVLGSKAETALLQTLTLSDGSLGIFVTRPRTAVMMALAFLIVFEPIFRLVWRRSRARATAPAGDTPASPTS